jgi:hypothetical protein
VESLRNTFTSVRGESSHTRNFKLVELTPTFSVADTMGLPDLSFKYLCAIKCLLDGTLVEKNGAAMKWSEDEDKECKKSRSHVLSTWIFYYYCVAGFVLVVCSYMVSGTGKVSSGQDANQSDLFFGGVLVLLWILVLPMDQIYLNWRKNFNELICCESPINQKRHLQAHAILFMIPYDDNQKDMIGESLIKMKEVVRHGSDFNLDMMDQMVFAVSDAPSDDKTFNKWVKKLGLPAEDVFAIRWSSISTDENIFIPPGTLFPILKRLQEKACEFYSEEIEAGRVTELFSWGFWVSGGMIVIVLLILTVVLVGPWLRSRFGFTIQVLLVLGLVMSGSLPVPVSPTPSPLPWLYLLPVSESLPCQILQTESIMKVAPLGRMLRGGRGKRTRATRISRWRCRMRNGTAWTKLLLAPFASTKYPHLKALSVRVGATALSRATRSFKTTVSQHK